MAGKKDSYNQDSRKSQCKGKGSLSFVQWIYTVVHLFQKFITFAEVKNQVLATVFIIMIRRHVCLTYSHQDFMMPSETLGCRRSVIVRPLTFLLSVYGFTNFYPKACFALKLR